MPFKLNIAEKNGKTWKIETSSETIIGKHVGDHIKGSDIDANLEGYELTIAGGSDNAGFPHKKDVEGQELKRVLLTKGWGMHKRPRREGKKKRYTPKGLRLRKTVRGSRLSEKTTQINLVVTKHGHKHLNEIFPDQNKPKEKKVEAAPAQ